MNTSEDLLASHPQYPEVPGSPAAYVADGAGGLAAGPAGDLPGGADGAQGARPVVPPALYLPTTGASSAWGAEILLHETSDGRLALLAYTALDRLARCMGPHQPWVLYPTERLGDLDATQPYQVIYLDQEVPRELWRQPGQQAQPTGQARQPARQAGQPGPQTTQPGRGWHGE